MSAKQSTFKTPIRYFLAIVFGYCLDFVVFAVLVAFGTSIYLANAFAFVVGSTVNTLLVRRFVFPDSRFSLAVDLLLSMLSNTLMFAAGMGILWWLVEVVGTNPYLAKLLANGATFFANYVIRLVFFRSR